MATISVLFSSAAFASNCRLRHKPLPAAEKVVRNHPDYQTPYTGITALKTGEVAYDAASYLAESEQKSCAIAAGCFVTVS